ncbi:MAG: NADP-dependent isocitrate dehydrogenase [Clostridiales Family XIII bacterium]|jgi:isocitrate dehydrogenase|nr:NADP-dependent isocitrate dehydrogenase [Clostridiales Family XIII bacterium]
MKNPVVEMDGDEMTRVIWRWVKELLLSPHVELYTEYYDLGLAKREETSDRVTAEAAEATLRHGVAVKCATITPNEERVKEYGLSQIWKSPNGTIRAILDGTVFRAPILVRGIAPYIPTWTKPITIARHAYGDVYRNVELAACAGRRAELVMTGGGAPEERVTIHEFGGGGVVRGVHNTDESIASFARACFSYALDTRQDLWFSTKDTISKTYDRRFRDIFESIFDAEYREVFSNAGITYFYTLIDDLVARVMRSEGGYIWACKNYDGDVMSDMVAAAYGSLAMMTSALVSPKGAFEYEAAHGTVQRHYYKYQNGEPTSTNPVATIFAWSGALRKRGETDGSPELVDFANRLERASLDTIESGAMTGDLYALSTLPNKRAADTEAFLRAVAQRLEASRP